MKRKRALLSLDEKQDEKNPHSRTIMESVEEQGAVENLLDSIVLKDIISSLPQRDKQIIALRFFFD